MALELLKIKNFKYKFCSQVKGREPEISYVYDKRFF